MRIKHSLEKVKSDFADRGLIVIGNYINLSTPIHCADKDNYRTVVSYNNFINRNQGYSRFHKSNPYTIENIHNWIKLNNYNIELLSTEYIDADGLLDIKCNACNTISPKTWKHLISKEGCSTCANKNMDIDIIKSLYSKIRTDIQINSTEYINCIEKLDCTCSNGHDFKISWDSLKIGCGCLQCFYDDMKISRKGELGSNWKGGTTELNYYLRSKLSPWWRDSMNSADNKCAITGKYAEVVHHIVGFNTIVAESLNEVVLDLRQCVSDYSKEELDLIESKCLELHYKYGFGACLTKKIHLEFHSIYKNGGNTKEQWDEFLLFKILGKEGEKHVKS